HATAAARRPPRRSPGRRRCGSSAPVRAVLRIAGPRVVGRHIAVLLPQLLLLPQERILLSGAVVGGDPALVLRPARPRGLPGRRGGSSAPVRAVLRIAGPRVVGRHIAVLLPQLLLLPQERILLSGAVVGGDPALVLRPVRPRGLPGQRAVPLAAVELFVRGRGLASVRLGR